jgi:hypothetical protein
LAAVSALLLAPVVWYAATAKTPRAAAWAWGLWLAALAGSYAAEIWLRQEFTVPFAQTRLLFWAGVIFAIAPASHTPIPRHCLLALLAVSWCASVSWGYNLPVLFATPWLFAVLEISRRLWQRAYPGLRLYGMNIAALCALLLIFRFGYEFVYRDGRRSEMDTHVGEVFPALGGIYSTAEKGRLYRDLKELAARHPNFKTLPAIPQANFLTGTYPPLPLDWVVNRETNGDNTLVLKAIAATKPVLFVEKTWIERSSTDPELTLTRDILRTGKVLDESPYFWVIMPE